MPWQKYTLSSVLFALCVIIYLPVANADAQSILAKKVSILERMHKKASRSLVTSAQDKLFKEYFAGNLAVKDNIDKLSLGVQKSYHVDDWTIAVISKH